jgi:hypothetical protein
MIIGITGTIGAGENVRGTFARPWQIFSEALAEKKISSRCTVSVRKGCGAPEYFLPVEVNRASI